MRIYILILILLLSSPVFAKEPYKDIETYGKCSPIIEGNNNKTTVNCYDIDPRANNQLNELLDKNLKLSQSLNKNLELLQKIKEAEEWAKRYHDLEESLKAMGDDDTDAKNALGLIKEGELDKAGAILDKILKKQESQGDKTAENQYNRGQLFLMQYKPLDALPHLEKAYNYRQDNPKYALEFAKLLQEQNNFKEAQIVYEKNLINLRKLSKSNPPAYLPDVAATLNNLGILYKDTQRHKDAETAFNKALSNYRKLAEANPFAYLPDVAMTLNNLGILYSDTQRHKDAEDAYNEALSTFRNLAEANPSAYLPYVAITLNNIAYLNLLTNDSEKGQTYVKEALKIIGEIYKNNPPAYGNDLAQSLGVYGMILIKINPKNIKSCDLFKEAEQTAYAESIKQAAKDQFNENNCK